MSIRISRITLAVLVALVVLFLMAKLRYAGKAPVKLQAEDCDRDLWKHVSEKERLRVVEECTSDRWYLRRSAAKFGFSRDTPNLHGA